MSSGHEAGMPRAPLRARLLVPAAALPWGLQFAFLNPSMGLLLATLYDATPVQVGWALAAYNLSGLVSTLVVPVLADRTGDYLTPMLGCGVLTIALASALALAPTLPLAVIALVALGGPAGVAFGLLFAHQRSVGASVHQIMQTRAMFSFAWVAGPPLATLLMGLAGRRSVLWAVVGIAVGSLAMTQLLRRRREVPAAPASRGEDGALRRVLASRQVLLLVLGFILFGCVTNAAVSVTTLFVTARLGLDVLWGGVALGTAALLEIPMLLLVGRAVGRLGARRLVVVGALAGVAYYAAMVVVTGPVGLIAAQVLNAAFIAGTSGVGLTIFQDVLPRPGLASGIFMNTNRLGAVFGGPVLTLGSMPRLGYATVYLACAVLAAAGVGFIVASRPRRRSAPA